LHLWHSAEKAKSDSEAVLEALRVSPYRRTRRLEFNVLFGYILGNRDGIDNWHLIPSSLRRSLGRKLAPVRSGRGVIEKEHRSAHRSPLQAPGPLLDSPRRRTLGPIALAPEQPRRLDSLAEQNRLSKNQSKPRLAFMRPTYQLTIDQHYCYGLPKAIRVDNGAPFG